MFTTAKIRVLTAALAVTAAAAPLAASACVSCAGYSAGQNTGLWAWFVNGTRW